MNYHCLEVEVFFVFNVSVLHLCPWSLRDILDPNQKHPVLQVLESRI